MINDIIIVHGDTVTACEIQLESRGVDFTFTGEAKMHPNDTYDRSIGEAYAVGRAFERAGMALITLATMGVDANYSDSEEEVLEIALETYELLMDMGIEEPAYDEPHSRGVSGD